MTTRPPEEGSEETAPETLPATSARPLRLFLALPVPQVARREAGRRCRDLRRDLPRARWVPPENLHVTLVFLGQMRAERVAPLVAAVAPAFAACPGLTLRFAGGGTYPPRRPAKVAWVGVEAEEGERRLLDLQQGVDEAARQSARLEPERRRWSPHLTVARPKERWSRRDSERFAAAFEAPLAPPCPLAAGHLVQSRLGRGPGGAPEYRTLATFPLGNGDRPSTGGEVKDIRPADSEPPQTGVPARSAETGERSETGKPGAPGSTGETTGNHTREAP